MFLQYCFQLLKCKAYKLVLWCFLNILSYMRSNLIVQKTKLGKATQRSKKKLETIIQVTTKIWYAIAWNFLNDAEMLKKILQNIFFVVPNYFCG